MTHVFISYSRKDKVYADKLHDDLIGRGFDIWRDTSALEPSQIWEREIRRGIEECAAFVLIVSPNAESSRWVPEEVHLARNLGKRVFPLLLRERDDGEPMFWYLSRVEWEDVTGGALPGDRFYRQLETLAAPKAQSGDSVAPTPPPAQTTDPNAPSTRSAPRPEIAPSRPRRPLWIGAVGVVAAAALVIAALLGGLGPGGSAESPTQAVSVADSGSTDNAAPAGEPSDADAAPDTTATPILMGTENDTWQPVVETINGIEFVYVPAGCFMMGVGMNTREVCISEPYWLARTEVTNAQYAAFLNDMGNQIEADALWLDTQIGYAQIQEIDGVWTPDDGYADHPVIAVTWYGARAYAEWLGCRLPTEAQWEYAAAGPEKWNFPWGDQFIEDYAVHDGNADGSAPVGSYPEGASWVGAFDLSGNVWEWVADWDGGYPPGTQVDPTGPEDGTARVLRGGSYSYGSYYLRTDSRIAQAPAYRLTTIGFRVACDALPAEEIAADPQVVIVDVVNAGSVNREGVVLRNDGDLAALAGWTLSDGDGHVFTFPGYILFSNTEITVYTRAGINTAVAFYWDQTQALWQAGDVVTLADDNGVVQSTLVVGE